MPLPPIPGVTPANNGQQLLDWITVNGPGTPVEAYGAEGDGTTDDTTAFQDAEDDLSAAGGGLLLVTAPHYRASFEQRPGVLVASSADPMKWAGGQSAVKISPPDGWAGGWVIDSPATQINTCGVAGILVDGGMTSTSDPDTGGIRIQSGVWVTVASCATTGTSLGGIKVVATAGIIQDNGVQNFWQWRNTAPTSYEGALWLVGTDFWVANNQANGGRVLTDALSTTTVENLYTSGNLWELLTSVMVGGNGEFAEVGTRASLYHCQTFGIRGDTNPGPGFHFTASSFGGSLGGTRHTGLSALDNCLAPNATQVMDAIYVDDANTDFESISLGPNRFGTTEVPRYGINDRFDMTGYSGHAINATANKYGTIRSLQNTLSPAYSQDTILRTIPVSFEIGGSGPANRRPASRFTGGESWFDTTQRTVATSDGDRWRNTTDVIVGNRVPAPAAYFTLATILWTPYNPGGGVTCTVSRVFSFWHIRPRILALTTTAAGVTAGYAAVVEQADQLTLQPVVAAETYQCGAFASGPVGRAGTTLEMGILWYDAGFNLLSATTALPATAIVAGDTANPTVLMSAAVAAPANAVWSLLSITGRATGLTAGDVFRVSGPCLVKAGSPVYTEPLET